MSELIRVVLVDDHPLMREGTATTLAAEADFEVVGQGSNAAEALRLAEELLPDIALLDVSMAGGGIEAARHITDACPVVKIVMLTVSEEEADVMAALRAGARGYVLKGVSGPELVRVLRAVHAGESYITPSLAAGLLVDARAGEGDSGRADRRLAQLTARERDILERLALGLSNKRIADELCLSEKTVKHYMTNILQKLQVRNRVEAALFAYKTRQS